MAVFGACGAFCAVVLADLPETEANASPQRLRQLAEGYQKAGQPLLAVEAYERLIAKEPKHRAVLAPVLVRLYASGGNKESALRWAQEAMKLSPEPQAFLAGVHTLLGDHDKAEAILRGEIGTQPVYSRNAVALHWQLADVLVRKGQVAAAEQVMGAAAELAKGRNEEESAQRRLGVFRRKHGLAPTGPTPKRASPSSPSATEP
jgi:tetratricopeptide (TPR) repeat protein